MGARVDFTNHITVSERTSGNSLLRCFGYQDLTDDLIEEITADPKIKYVQINEPLPPQAFAVIDKLLSKRGNLCFRIFSLGVTAGLDLSCLRLLPHLRNLMLDGSLRGQPDILDLTPFLELKNLQSLYLDLFDLRDYHFLQSLPSGLKELGILADTLGGGIVFDCDWLTQYQALETLCLGQKAKKHIEHIAGLEGLRHLTLRGIKLKDFSFLKERNLQSLSVNWCGMSDLSSLTGFDSLKSLALWRILGLEDISFISTLTGLERLSLSDLKHITSLPDLSELKNLREISLSGVPIDVTALPEPLRHITSFSV